MLSFRVVEGTRTMLFQLNTDNHIAGREALATRVETDLRAALERFAHQVTRVEVHLGDDNGRKKGDNDKRCAVEARLAGLQPITVNHNAHTLDEAIDGAVDKLVKVLEKTTDKLSDRKGNTSFGGDQKI
jgi:ribosomal subunit interface protein